METNIKANRRKLKNYLKKKWELKKQLEIISNSLDKEPSSIDLKNSKAKVLEEFNKQTLLIEELIKLDKELSCQIKILCQIQGVGPALSSAILIEIPNFRKLSIESVLKRLRLDQPKRKKHNGTKYKDLKSLLYLCAYKAMRYNFKLQDSVEDYIYQVKEQGDKPLKPRVLKDLYTIEFLWIMHRHLGNRSISIEKFTNR